jgi:ADP-ribose pyrophosphatase YjhB (NUDIX family)
MTNINIKLHYFQKELVKKLSSNPNMRFNDLLIEELESEHMNYHLKRLVEIGFVVKGKTKYRLTDTGKDYTNLLDEETDLIEKQPKTSIVVCGIRENNKGEVEHLLNKRLRQPYYGKVGRITGKVRFGETLKEAAERELYEETGLKAKSVVLEEIYRKMRKREDNTWVQDVIFYVFFATGFSGTLIKKTAYQENFWATKKEIESAKDIDPYDDLVLVDRLKPNPLTIRESSGIAEGF